MPLVVYPNGSVARVVSPVKGTIVVPEKKEDDAQQKSADREKDRVNEKRT